MANEFNNLTPESITGTPRADAIVQIKEMARAQGLGGQFKVKYNGQAISRPTDLPEIVQMGQVQVYASLDQASSFKA
jgi:hypothetical protein